MGPLVLVVSVSRKNGTLRQILTLNYKQTANIVDAVENAELGVDSVIFCATDRHMHD